MSSFKRKTPSKQPPPYPGTRPSPASIATTITSTGIPSLDDILGGGLPLSTSLLVLAPDLHSSYGDLVQKYFVAEGLVCGHRVCVVHGNGKDIVKDVMWLPKASPVGAHDEGDESQGEGLNQKVKIAWRYEHLKQFQTTVESSSSSYDNYCHTFDLSARVPETLVEDAINAGQLSLIDTGLFEPGHSSTAEILGRITQLLESDGTPTTPIRICIPSFGSPELGDVSSQEILQFLHSLRLLLRKHPHACASMSLSPNLSTENWGGPGWVQKLGWLSDAAFTMAAFSANPSLSAVFPSHHGLVHIHTLPAPHTLVPASDRFSTLRGLSSVSSSGGGGENNLAFKCTRKRLVFETLHLDLDGGVSERRTTPSAKEEYSVSSFSHGHHGHQEEGSGKAAISAVQVQLEDEGPRSGTDMAVTEEVAGQALAPEETKKKQKKKVAFRSDRPDLYDF